MPTIESQKWEIDMLLDRYVDGGVLTPAEAQPFKVRITAITEADPNYQATFDQVEDEVSALVQSKVEEEDS